MCASIDELIEALEAIRSSTGGEVLVEMGIDARGSDFHGIGHIELAHCDCCVDGTLLNLIPCTCEEEALAEFAPGEVDYMEVDFLKGYGSLN